MPQSFYTDVVEGVSSLVELVSDRPVPVVSSVSQVFLEAGVEGVSRFADENFGAYKLRNVVRLAVELFGDVYLGFRSLDADVSADEGAQ